ncbi:MAG TPA: superoxide dismutase [Steroidobacteraceae bacterium]|nr:superoxide dismutase [Steroidobacteraceae bacterium]
MTRYALPDLEYDYGALEPHISARIMELHHGKHHKAYVDGANKTLEQLQEARQKGALDAVGTLERTLAFHISGHVLHSLFWRNLSPKGGGAPGGELATAIDANFGSFELFKTQLNKTAATIQGSGWAALCYEPLAQRLIVGSLHDHQQSAFQGSVPIMVVDAWEHAFYLQYVNEKVKFFDALWNLWNWSDIGHRYAEVKKLSLALAGAAAA